MTLTRNAFLSVIAECPADEAARLIYADWLDDHGEADRAELIRAQCRLAALPDDSPERRPLAWRVGELLDLHEEDWRATLPPLDGVTWGDFTRGFVEAVFVETAEAFLCNAEALFTAAPVRPDQGGRTAATPAWSLGRSRHLARLTELNVGNNPGLGRAGVRCLAGSPYAVGLTSLLMHYCNLGDDGVVPLTRSCALVRLVELYLSGNELTDLAGEALGEMPNLELIDLRDNRLVDTAMHALAFSAGRQELRTLWLVNNRVGATGAEALAWTTDTPRLRCLYLNYNPIGNDGAVALAESPHRGALVELDLRHCEVRDTGARALASSPFLESIESLWLGGNRMRMETLTVLRRRFGDRLRL